MREHQRNLIHRMAAHDPAAGHEFVGEWGSRITAWVAQRADPQKVEDYTQEVWGHLIAGNWLRLLQWNGLYDDDAWQEHSLEAYLKKITINKVSDLQSAEPPQLPPGLNPAEIIDRATALGNDPLVEAERGRLMRAFDHCTRWFKSRDHLAIRLWWEGHSAQQIAEHVRTNPNNVYQRRSYLFKRVRACLVETLPEYFRDV